MARSNPKPTARKGDEPKAGKKKRFRSPPPVNREKQDRREAGEQQFHSKVNFTEEVQSFKMKNGVLMPSVKHVSIPYLYDETRKRVVFNSFFNHGKRD